MKALVTGDAGFVGRHFSRRLHELGYHVFGCDIINRKDARDAFRYLDDKYDLVVHCAYNVGGRANIDGVNLALADNVELDSMMFKWALKHARQVLYFSSSAAYPIHLQEKTCYCEWCLTEGGYPRTNPVRLQEGDIQLYDVETPDADYGWAKLTGERLAQKARQLGLDVRIVRPFSGYGSDQSLDYPFPSIIRRARLGDLTVWGPPGQTRDWIHIDDVIEACLAMIQSDVVVSNLCTGIGTEMGDLMRMARAMASVNDDDASVKVKYLVDKPTGVFYRVGDPTVMETFYKPTISLEEGISRAFREMR